MQPTRVRKFTTEMRVTALAIDQFDKVEVTVAAPELATLGSGAPTITEGQFTLFAPSLPIGKRVLVEITLIDD